MAVRKFGEMSKGEALSKGYDRDVAEATKNSGNCYGKQGEVASELAENESQEELQK